VADEVFEQGVRAVAPIACPPVMDGRHAPLDDGHTDQGEDAMALRKLRVYTGPDADAATAFQAAPQPNSVRVTLGEILPLLADAVASNRTWLTDFEADEVTISSDLHDVLQAYRHFRRPGA
jgi:hypothetical protein